MEWRSYHPLVGSTTPNRPPPTCNMVWPPHLGVKLACIQVMFYLSLEFGHGVSRIWTGHLRQIEDRVTSLADPASRPITMQSDAELCR